MKPRFKIVPRFGGAIGAPNVREATATQFVLHYNAHTLTGTIHAVPCACANATTPEPVTLDSRSLLHALESPLPRTMCGRGWKIDVAPCAKALDRLKDDATIAVCSPLAPTGVLY